MTKTITSLDDLTPDPQNASMWYNHTSMQAYKEGSMTSIYALVDPRTDIVRYIGKSNDIAMRMRRHLKDARDKKTDHKSWWVAMLLNLGLLPVLVVLEECDQAIWKERECYWIEYYRSRGVDLTNAKDGGDGYEPSEATRAKMSRAKIGRPAHNKGVSPSVETKRKQSMAAKRRHARMTDEEKAQWYARLSHGGSYPGWHHTTEARERISTSLIGNKRTLGYKATPETRKKLSDAQKGRIVSEETRRKIGEANRQRALERKQQHGKTD